MIYIFSNYSRSDRYLLPVDFMESVDIQKDAFIHLNDCRFFAANRDFFRRSCRNYIAICNKSLLSSGFSFLIKNKCIKELLLIGENKIITAGNGTINFNIDGFLQKDVISYDYYKTVSKPSTGFICYFLYKQYLNDDATLVNFLHDGVKDQIYLHKFLKKHDAEKESACFHDMHVKVIAF